MPSDLAQREQRLAAIRAALEDGSVRSQAELLERLRARGFEVAQSSISRDLRELGVAKVKGCYVLMPAVAPGAEPAEPDAIEATALRGSIQGVLAAGPNLVVVKTVAGMASAVGYAVDQARWPETVGTVAGDDTLFIATPGKREQARLVARMQRLMEGISTHA